MQTAASNSFQQNTGADENTIAQKALEEFDHFAETLHAKGVNVIIFEDTVSPIKPDAIFPNNWISFHSDGTVILYPMCTPNRRIERRQDIIENLKRRFTISNIINLSSFENEGKFLEGTGSIVFDHDNKIAYASISQRTNRDLFLNLCATLNYKSVCFHSHNEQEQEIYHTNVMMCIAEKYCVLCTESIDNADDRELVVSTLKSSGHEIVEISLQQMNNFAGNMLAVQTTDNKQLLILSQSAFDSLTEQQIQTLSKYAELHPIPIPTIETIGGGSARCMMAEVFLSSKV